MKYRCEETYTEEFENTKRIVLGSEYKVFGSDHSYYIYRDDKPYVIVEVCLSDHFSDTVLFHDHFVIGNYYEGVYIIDLLGLNVTHKDISGYFGGFEIIDDDLYVLGCDTIIAVDSHMTEKWTSEDIAVDGVLLKEIEGDSIIVSCEMDPPDGWVDKRISLSNGKLI